LGGGALGPGVVALPYGFGLCSHRGLRSSLGAFGALEPPGALQRVLFEAPAQRLAVRLRGYGCLWRARRRESLAMQREQVLELAACALDALLLLSSLSGERFTLLSGAQCQLWPLVEQAAPTRAIGRA
jgi:hypothetical protein